MTQPRFLPKTPKGERVVSVRPVADGGCPNCGKDITAGRRHVAPDGMPCKGRPVEIHLDELPPVVIPPEKPKWRPRKASTPPPTRYATGKCHDCSRPISGERWYCGPCFVQRNEERTR